LEAGVLIVSAYLAAKNPFLRRTDMFHIRSLTLAAVAVIGLCTASSANAQPGYYGMLSNNSGMRVTYQWRINNGAWTTTALAPGEVDYFGVSMSRLQAYRGRYEVQIRYDSLVGPGVNFQIKTLGVIRANSPAGGYRSKFLRSNPYNQRTWIYLGS
jgi:hypothetical protein